MPIANAPALVIVVVSFCRGEHRGKTSNGKHDLQGNAQLPTHLEEDLEH